MEVLFAVAGCLGAFALGTLTAGRNNSRRQAAGQEEEEIPQELRQQWENFLSYTGYPEEEGPYED